MSAPTRPPWAADPPTAGELVVAPVATGGDLVDLLGRRAPALLVGLGTTNLSVARALVGRGHRVTVVDDRPRADTGSRAAAVGAVWAGSPDVDALATLVDAHDLVVPTPGLPEAHPVFGLARDRGRPLVSELDLAAAWDERPLVAVTGTNAKTTVVELVTAALGVAGRRARAAGNTGVPLVAAIDDPVPEIFVVEASSFRLARTCLFAPLVGVWTNFAPDHLDVHLDLAGYRSAKARLWDRLDPAGTAVVNLADPVVAASAPRDREVVTYRADGSPATLHRDGDLLVGPDGAWARRSELWRGLPHDVENVLAAGAVLARLELPLSAVARAAADFPGLPHRLETVARVGGVAFHDDSKSTTPHATVAAVRSFERVVLIAGGRNKGLDLGELEPAAERLAAVVAIGEAADEIAAVFAGRTEVVRAASMDDAVRSAFELARASASDVLLSPACASFDAYRDYAHRGEDFARAVRELAGAGEGIA